MKCIIISIAIYTLLIFNVSCSKSFNSGKLEGNILQIKGTGFLTHENNKSELKSGMKLVEGDIIETNQSSEAQISFGDERNVSLGESSKLTINKTNVESFEVGIKKGKMASHITKLTSGIYSVKSPSTALGVRGTTFYNEVKEDGSTFTCVCDGKVSITPIIPNGVDKVYNKNDTVEIPINKSHPDSPGHNENHNHKLSS